MYLFTELQISQHQINTVQSLARFLGWHVVSSSAHLGLGPVEPLGNASSCMLSSPSGNKLVELLTIIQHHIDMIISHLTRSYLNSAIAVSNPQEYCSVSLTVPFYPT